MAHGKTEFSTVDYVVFSIALVISVAIGIYYGCTGGRGRSPQEYLMANRKMSILPVALSLLASFMSAVTLLGTPAEVYTFGTMYMWIGPSYIFVVALAAHVYIPIFFKLNLTSAYEYLELRFSYGIRAFGSLVFIFQMVIYMAIVLYAPALALNAVTGLDVLMSVFTIGLICTFYTTVGGMKGVMWTDTFLIFIMFAGMIAVIAQGSKVVGGFDRVWEINQQSGRVEFWDFDPDIFKRHTVWSLGVGGIFTWVAIYGVNQAQVQRALTVPDLRSAQIALWINLPGLFFLMMICSFAGMCIYAVYADCDPLKTGQIKAKDQLLAFFVMEQLSFLPGLPGLFVACLFSGALSTLSSGMNSLAAVTLEDFIRRRWPNLTELRASILSRIIAVVYGLVAIALTFVAKQLGGVLEAILSIFGMIGGPLLGLFSLGVFVPLGNKWGAGVGLLSGLVLSFVIGLGAWVTAPFTPKKPVSVAGCDARYNTSVYSEQFGSEFVPFAPGSGNYSLEAGAEITLPLATPKEGDEDIPDLYRLSYMWYSAWGCVTVMLVGSLVSAATGGWSQARDLDPRLVYPVFDRWYPLRWLPERFREVFRCGVDFSKIDEGETAENADGVEENGYPEKDNYATQNKAFDNGVVDTKL